MLFAALLSVSISPFLGQTFDLANAASVTSNPTFLSTLPQGSIGQYTDGIHQRGNAAIISATAVSYPDVNSFATVACTQPFGSEQCSNLVSKSFIYYHFGLCLSAIQVSCIKSITLNGRPLSFVRYVGPEPIAVDSGVIPNWIPENISIWGDSVGNHYAVNVLSIVNHEYSRDYEANISRVIDLTGDNFAPVTAADLSTNRLHPECAYLDLGHCGKIIDFLPNSVFSLSTQITSRTNLGQGAYTPRSVLSATLADATASNLTSQEVNTETISGAPLLIPTFYRVLTGQAAKQAVQNPDGRWLQYPPLNLGTGWSKIQGPAVWSLRAVGIAFSDPNCLTGDKIVEIQSSDTSMGNLDIILEPVIAGDNRANLHVQISYANSYASCLFASAGAEWPNQARLWATNDIFNAYPLYNVKKVTTPTWINFSADLPANAWQQQFPYDTTVQVILPKEHLTKATGYITTTTKPPSVSGKLKVGSTVKIVSGTYLNLNPVKIKGYQWLSCTQPQSQDSYGFSCSIVPKSNSNTYTLAKSDLGHYIVARELWVMPDRNNLSGQGGSSLRSSKVTK